MNTVTIKLESYLGQRKRVLARAIAQEGQIILLDEPFNGIDVKTEDQIINLLNEFRKEGKVMLISTHNLGTVPEFVMISFN